MQDRFKSIAAAYDSHAENELHLGTVGHLEPRYSVLKSILNKYKKDSDTFIDVGSGVGILSLWLSDHHHSVNMIDVSGRCLEYAKLIASRRNLDKRISFYPISAESLFDNTSVSMVNFGICLGVTHHAHSIENIDLILRGLNQKISMNGYLLISFLNGLPLLSSLLASNSICDLKKGITNIQQLHSVGCFSILDENKNLFTWACNSLKAKEILHESGFDIVGKYGIDAILNGINWELAKSSLGTQDFAYLRETLHYSHQDDVYFERSSILHFVCRKIRSI